MFGTKIELSDVVFENFSEFVDPIVEDIEFDDIPGEGNEWMKDAYSRFGAVYYNVEGVRTVAFLFGDETSWIAAGLPVVDF